MPDNTTIPSFDDVMKSSEAVPSFQDIMGDEEPKKKRNGTPSSNGSGQPTLRSALSSVDNPILNLNKKTPAITTADGIEFPLTHPTILGNSPDAINGLQKRVASQTFTPTDVDIISTATKKSPKVVDAYLRDKNLGFAADTDESITKTKEAIRTSINVLNRNYGTNFNPDDVLSSPQKSSQFLQQVKEFRKNPVDQEKQALNEFTNISHADFNTIQNNLSDNIRRLTAEESIAKGLSTEQTADLLYQRLDPKGYIKNREVRKPKGFVTTVLSSASGAGLAKNIYDWATDADRKNIETLETEKGQYELEVNRGLEDLALEKKARGVLTNDPQLLDEANGILKKVKPTDEIVERYPLLMKQRMVDYGNRRFAEDAGILEGTQESGKVGKNTLLFGINDSQARKYLKEGGFLDNPKYKDLAEEIIAHPKTYFADNSPFGSIPSAFLKPIKAVFHTYNDLTGARTDADRRSENIEERLFPEQLTEGVKEDISFDVGGHHFGMNTASTINSVANLAGYMAVAAATGGVSSALGASASTAGRVGAWSSFGMEAVDTGLKEADNMGLNPAQSALYAALKGTMMAEGGRLFEFGKAAIPSIKGVNEKLAQAAKGISDKSITRDAAKELLDNASNAWGKGLAKYGIGTAKGAGVMAGFGVGDTLLKVAFNDENASTENILPEAANAYFNGLFTMGILGSMGLKGNIENAKNSTYKGMLKRLVDNHDASKDILQIGLDQGIYTKPEFDRKVQILNTGVAAKSTLQKVMADQGLNLSPEQQSVWVANKTAELLLREEAKNASEPNAKKYTEQADNLLKQSTDIVDGLTFDHLLRPQYDLHNANLELREAQEIFSEFPTDANEQTVLEKKAAVDKIRFAPQGEVKTTEVTEPDINKLLEPHKDSPIFMGMESNEEKIKYIAQQAQNVSHDGIKLEGDAYNSTVNNFGEELVKAATTAYPLETLLKKPDEQATETKTQETETAQVQENSQTSIGGSNEGIGETAKKAELPIVENKSDVEETAKALEELATDKNTLYRGYGGNTTKIQIDKFGDNVTYLTDNADYADSFSLDELGGMEHKRAEKGGLDAYTINNLKTHNVTESQYYKQAAEFTGKNINDLTTADINKFNEKIKSDGFDAIKIDRVEPNYPQEGTARQRNNDFVTEYLIFDKTKAKKLEGAGDILNKSIVRKNAKATAEEYHKAKADGSNPELVKAVENLLGNTEKKQPLTVSEPKQKEPTVENKSDVVGVGGDAKTEVLYHSSKDNVFSEGDFKPIFFSPNKEYSDQYGKGKSNAYEVTINKPFDTSDEQARKIYNEEFLPYAKEKSKGDKRYEPLKEGEKVPFTTADALYVFLRKSKREGKDFGYDGVVVDEKINGEYSKFPLEKSQVKEMKSTVFDNLKGEDLYYVEPSSPNRTAIEAEIKVSDLQGAVNALEKAEIHDFEANESQNTIKILDFSNGEDLGFNEKLHKLADEFKNNNIDHETKFRSVESRYVDPAKRAELLQRLERDMEQRQSGSDIHNLYKEASARSEAFQNRGKESVTPAPQAEPQPEKTIGKFEAKARELAKKIDEAEIPQWLINTDKSIKKSGISGESIKEALKDAAIHVGRLLDKGVEFADAIKEGADMIVKHMLSDYPSQKPKPEYEEKVRAGFEKYYNENVVGEEPPKGATGSGVSGGEGTGITHAQTAETRAEFGLREYEKYPETFAQWDALADARIKNGEMPELLRKMRKGDSIDKVEQRMMGKYIADLKATAERTKSNQDIAALYEAVQLSDLVGGSEKGRELVARKGTFLEDDSLAGYFVKELESSAVDNLTDSQKALVEKEYNSIKKAEQDWNTEREKLNAEISKLKAQSALNKSNKTVKPRAKSDLPKTHNDFVSERERLRDKLKTQFEEYKASLNRIGIAADGGTEGFKLTVKMAKTIGEIVKSHVEEIGGRLGEVTKRTFDDVKDLFEGITEKDIHDIIAGEYNEKQKPLSDLRKQLQDLKEEARLINKLDALQKGEQPKDEKKKVERNQNIKKLREEIKKFNKSRKEGDKFIPDEIAGDAKKLESFRSRNEKATSKIQEQIKTGDFKKETPTPVLKDAELKKKYPERFKRAQEAQDRYIKAKTEREVRLLQQEYANRTQTQKVKDAALEVLNIPRTLMSSVDFSAPLRQAVIPTISHPVLAVKAFGEMFRQSVSQKRFDRWFFDLRRDPEFHTMERSGLYVADPHDLRLAAKEEQFMNNLAEKIPVIGKLVKGSERAYVGYLNKMRVDLFKQGEQVLLSRGKTIENAEKEYKALASWVNNSTGRGNFAKAEVLSPYMNAVFFSPRLIASRLNLLNPIYYGKLPKDVRKMALGDMAKFIGFGLSVLAVASLNGADVETDPRSTDFGKIKVGDTRYDIWGGFQQYIRFFSQAFKGESKSQAGKIRKIDGSGRFGENRGDLITRFFRGKLAPIPATITDFTTGRTIMGDKIVYKFGGNQVFDYGKKLKDKEISATDEALKLVMPLVVSDVSSALRSEGVKSLGTVWLPATFGIGVQNYNNDKK